MALPDELFRMAQIYADEAQMARGSRTLHDNVKDMSTAARWQTSSPVLDFESFLLNSTYRGGYICTFLLLLQAAKMAMAIDLHLKKHEATGTLIVTMDCKDVVGDGLDWTDVVLQHLKVRLGAKRSRLAYTIGLSATMHLQGADLTVTAPRIFPYPQSQQDAVATIKTAVDDLVRKFHRKFDTRQRRALEKMCRRMLTSSELFVECNIMSQYPMRVIPGRGRLPLLAAIPQFTQSSTKASTFFKVNGSLSVGKMREMQQHDSMPALPDQSAPPASLPETEPESDSEPEPDSEPSPEPMRRRSRSPRRA